MVNELLQDLEQLKKLVNDASNYEPTHDEMVEIYGDDYSDYDIEFRKKERLLELIAEEYLNLGCYSREHIDEFLTAIAKILNSGASLEYYKLGVLLLFLSENYKIADDLLDVLDIYL